MKGETYLFKIVIGGQGAVGKTTLLHRYLNGTFLQNSTMTIGVGFHSKEIHYEQLQKKIKLSLWDLGGQDHFRFLQANYSKGAKAGIVFFDMSRIGTITQVKNWVYMFHSQTLPDIPIVLGGTMLDLVEPDQREDVAEMARVKVSDLGLACYIPTSSKSGENVDMIFKYITDSMVVQCQGAKIEKVSATVNDR